MASFAEETASLLDKRRIEDFLFALNEQRTLCRFCDVILNVCGDEIHAHSNVLAAASPYFSSFLGKGQDVPRAFSQKTPQVIEIHIDGSDGDSGYGEAVKRVVNFMYTNSICLNMRIVTQISEISKIMQMESLIAFCDDFQNGFKGSKVVPILENVSKHDVAYVHIGTSTADLPATYEVEKALAEPYNKNNLNNTSQTKKRGRGRPRKVQTKEEESDDDFSEFVSDILAKEEEDKVTQTKTEICDDSIVKEEENTECEDSQFVNLRRTRGRPGSRIIAGRSHRLNAGKAYHFKNDYILPPLRRKCSDAQSDEEESINEKGYCNKSKCYKCDKCDYKTKRAKAMAEHRNNHLHQEFICNYCVYKAEHEDDFKSHMDKHNGPKPYFCHFCDNRYSTKTMLNVHLPKHKDDKPFVCEVCLAAFKWKHSLKTHMITHSQSKDHLCDICGFATAHKSQLKAHKLVHTGDTFKCQVESCNYQATKRQNLKYHMLTHTQEKPHQCDICGHSFSLIKNMKRHMLMHTGVRPYACDHCNFTATRFDKIKLHMLKQHGIGQPPAKKHRLSDYQKEEGVLAEEEIVSEATLHTVANIAALAGSNNGEETQIFSTVDGVPIVAHIQYAEVNSQGVIQYVAQVD